MEIQSYEQSLKGYFIVIVRHSINALMAGGEGDESALAFKPYVIYDQSK